MPRVRLQAGFVLPYKRQYTTCNVTVSIELENADAAQAMRDCEEFVYGELDRQLQIISDRGPEVSGQGFTPKRRSGPTRRRP